MTKKILAAMVAAAMVMSMTACGGTKNETAKSEASQTDTQKAETQETQKEEDQQAGQSSDAKEFKVGIVQFVDDASLNQIQDNIQKELDAKSAELGVTFDYKDYTFNGQADATTLNQIITQLISDEVDVIVPIATPTAQIAQAATEDNQIPVVFSAVSDPVGAKLVASMDAPGANITGTSDALNTNTIMDLIFAADPDADYIGLLYSKSEDASTQAIADAKAYLDGKNIKYIEKTGNTTDEVRSAVDALVSEGVDAVFTPTDNTIMTAELAIYEKFLDAKIPHYAGADSFALNGAFLGFGVDYSNLGVVTADMVVDILVNGKNPAELGVQTFDNGLGTVNTDTCAALGYDFDTIQTAFSAFCTDVKGIETAENFQ